MVLDRVILQKSIAVFLLTLLIGCASTASEQLEAVDNIPPWVLNLPESDIYFHGVGISGPAYYQEDGLVQAADKARVELAKTVSSHIKDVTLIIETNEGLMIAEEAWVLNMITASTDLILEHSEIVAAWRDKAGIGPTGIKGTHYALARMPKVLKIKETTE